MKPISLTLRGFRGIRDGLGRDELHLDLAALSGGASLVALVGCNGRGKSTVLDNLTPFLTMPSRAGGDGGGSFHYYEHVCLPESTKELVWEHAGQRYRSTVLIRTNGRRKTEAYLHEWRDGWRAARLPDGTQSDGRIDSYERCVESLLGTPRAFFVSVFAAQGRRHLAAYDNGEIKALLADILGLDAIRALGIQANEVVKLLRGGLTRLRQESAQCEVDLARIVTNHGVFGDTAARAGEALALRTARAAGVSAAERELARAEALATQEADTDSRRRRLEDELAQIDGLELAGRQDRAALRQRELARDGQASRRMVARAKAAAERRVRARAERSEWENLLALEARIVRAGRRLGLARQVLSAREAAVQVNLEQVLELQERQAERRRLAEAIAAIEREAGQVLLRSEDAGRRACLTGQVPCRGHAMQAACQLLADARTAAMQSSSLQAERSRLLRERDGFADSLVRVDAQIAVLESAPMCLRRARSALEATRNSVAARADWAGRAVALGRARAALARLDEQQRAADLADTSGDAEDARERECATNELARIDAIDAREEERCSAQRTRVRQAIADLPVSQGAERVASARAALAQARQSLDWAENSYVNAMRDQQRQADLTSQRADVGIRRDRLAARVRLVEAELGYWQLLTKAFSNDGVIALAIDDAGPALAALANDLLLACYGGRFSLSIQTQVANANGQMRESFDVLVYDADAASSKSVSEMSGGERVWINECLTRAIALYLAQQGGRQYRTLFSDEADGALDSDRKRMFMAMKREVLRIGGYDQEFFVSQTPELADMADVCIDLDKYCVSEQEGLPKDWPDDHAVI
ncbi:DNA repair protein [Massilia sp. TS11]|uniref:DNA repair protein n=1 Tax=Massilia sp. TS11 TaxID=2908003 RepID=UPI001EDADAD2|nr:DNA repair protein [Massilia sp. TS11]MCG2583845.1 DNA repair protein [Massilia sp. TS11]